VGHLVVAASSPREHLRNESHVHEVRPHGAQVQHLRDEEPVNGVGHVGAAQPPAVLDRGAGPAGRRRGERARHHVPGPGHAAAAGHRHRTALRRRVHHHRHAQRAVHGHLPAERPRERPGARPWRVRELHRVQHVHEEGRDEVRAEEGDVGVVDQAGDGHVQLGAGDGQLGGGEAPPGGGGDLQRGVGRPGHAPEACPGGHGGREEPRHHPGKSQPSPTWTSCTVGHKSHVLPLFLMEARGMTFVAHCTPQKKIMTLSQ